MGLALDSADELSRRRRAVFRGLSPYVSGDRLMAAMWVWEEGGFGGQAAFAFQHYLARVCDTPTLKELRRDIYLSLVKSMTLPPNALPPDPITAMRVQRSQQAAGKVAEGDTVQRPVAVPDGNVVFVQVVNGFLTALEEDGPASTRRIRGYVLSGLTKLHLDRKLSAQLVGWLTNDAVHLVVPIPLDVMRKLIHSMYVMACQYFGPVVADRHLAGAVRAASALAAAKRFPPAQLL